MAGMADQRLLGERKRFRKERPYGFVAKPATRADGSVDMRRWQCRIPGPAKTAWAEGLYPLEVVFGDNYPSEPPVCSFPAGFFHPNVYPGGRVCLSLLSSDSDLGGQWAPSITLTQLLKGIQELLSTPNVYSPAQDAACKLLKSDPAKYEKAVAAQAKRYPQEQPGDD
ncbi:hypothetical protein HYH03_002877 [Edaphochlamys debaryana]|uniref:UBC core domain-containing protein n=1 Tax=Edaphochlamys debaryana TaxID=47281 RepID=A0A836C4Z7_9CHLO|nr:hypothetical protein HYH03_002877 [Edaphochlamys debaryana]|eukprot:KAG2499299.1 hypothetical protein HYH03_002877 [Edaphochlamys debaryana]